LLDVADRNSDGNVTRREFGDAVRRFDLDSNGLIDSVRESQLLREEFAGVPRLRLNPAWY
jgi:hypothetical protein